MWFEKNWTKIKDYKKRRIDGYSRKRGKTKGRKRMKERRNNEI